MLHFDNLDFYGLPKLPINWTAPVWLKLQLGLFSGRLYFSADEYSHVCEHLNLTEGGSGNLIWQTSDAPSLDNRLSFVREWLLLRRREQDFAHTAMGMLCQQRSLSSKFFLLSSRNQYTDDNSTKEIGNANKDKNEYVANDCDNDDDDYDAECETVSFCQDD